MPVPQHSFHDLINVCCIDFVHRAAGKHYVTGFVTVTVKPGSVPQRMEPHKCLGTRPHRLHALPCLPIASLLEWLWQATAARRRFVHIRVRGRMRACAAGWNWVKFEDIGRGEQAGRVFKPLHALVEGGPGSGRRSGQSVADLITGAELHALHSA